MAHMLENYLRTYRKRSGLSQREVAFLLGWDDRTTVSRYEFCRRRPSLETAFRLQALLRAPASSLFTGLYAKVARQTAVRTQTLIKRLETKGKSDPVTLHKLARLRAASRTGEM